VLPRLRLCVVCVWCVSQCKQRRGASHHSAFAAPTLVPLLPSQWTRSPSSWCAAFVLSSTWSCGLWIGNATLALLPCRARRRAHFCERKQASKACFVWRRSAGGTGGERFRTTLPPPLLLPLLLHASPHSSPSLVYTLRTLAPRRLVAMALVRAAVLPNKTPGPPRTHLPLPPPYHVSTIRARPPANQR